MNHIPNGSKGMKTLPPYTLPKEDYSVLTTASLEANLECCKQNLDFLTGDNYDQEKIANWERRKGATEYELKKRKSSAN